MLGAIANPTTTTRRAAQRRVTGHMSRCPQPRVCPKAHALDDNYGEEGHGGDNRPSVPECNSTLRPSETCFDDGLACRLATSPASAAQSSNCQGSNHVARSPAVVIRAKKSIPPVTRPAWRQPLPTAPPIVNDAIQSSPDPKCPTMDEYSIDT